MRIREAQRHTDLSKVQHILFAVFRKSLSSPRSWPLTQPSVQISGSSRSRQPLRKKVSHAFYFIQSRVMRSSEQVSKDHKFAHRVEKKVDIKKNFTPAATINSCVISAWVSYVFLSQTLSLWNVCRLVRKKQCCGSGSGILDLVTFWPLVRGSGMGKKSRSGSGMNILDHISESLETFFELKFLNSLMRVRMRIRESFDPGSGVRDGRNTSENK